MDLWIWKWFYCNQRPYRQVGGISWILCAFYQSQQIGISVAQPAYELHQRQRRHRITPVSVLHQGHISPPTAIIHSSKVLVNIQRQNQEGKMNIMGWCDKHTSEWSHFSWSISGFIWTIPSNLYIAFWPVLQCCDEHHELKCCRSV